MPRPCFRKKKRGKDLNERWDLWDQRFYKDILGEKFDKRLADLEYRVACKTGKRFIKKDGKWVQVPFIKRKARSKQDSKKGGNCFKNSFNPCPSLNHDNLELYLP